MPYTQRITRANPSCIFFIVDQSGSMADGSGSGRNKAEEVAVILNRCISDLIESCGREEGVRDYFEVGILGYGGRGVQNGFAGVLSASIMHPVSEIEASARVENIKRKVSDGAGGLVEEEIKFRVWYDAVADGGTPMCEALRQAATHLLDWCDTHPNNFPPVVIHVTDGESTDGNPESIGEQLRQISTEDGQLIFMNCFISSGATDEDTIAFPNSDNRLPNDYARLLYRMSSTLAGSMIDAAKRQGFAVDEQSRAFMWRAPIEKIIEFLQIGTSYAANLR